jgi:hypothetical protein
VVEGAGREARRRVQEISPSRYTDTLAVMQRRGWITPQMRQAAVVGDHVTLDEALALHGVAKAAADH